jgi:hypothetical protein
MKAKAQGRVHYPKYTVEWSQADQEFVATCDWYPSMSFLARDCVRALDGLADLLLDEFGEDGLAERRLEINRERGFRE